EHSEEASKPLWVHPAIGHSFRSTIPDWQGWPPFTFVRRLVRNKLRRWFDERRKRRDIYEDDHTSREIRH
ncbi:wd g-beta repeat-containing protein, partial [Cystoisospora suis]